jgi:hypothetical protein
MEPTADTTKPEEQTPPIDTYWLVANIFAIIHYLEDKFGPQSLEQIVAVATSIEESMRKESEEKK